MGRCRDCAWWTGDEKVQGKECLNPANQKKWSKGNCSMSVKYKKPNHKCKNFATDIDTPPISTRENHAPRGTTKWMGLWSQERPSLYAGQVIKKSEIPAYTRIVLRYNKYYEKDGNRPRFVYCFADSEGYANKCIPIEYEEYVSERSEVISEIVEGINKYLDELDKKVLDMDGCDPYSRGLREGASRVVDEATRILNQIERREL